MLIWRPTPEINIYLLATWRPGWFPKGEFAKPPIPPPQTTHFVKFRARKVYVRCTFGFNVGQGLCTVHNGWVPVVLLVFDWEWTLPVGINVLCRIRFWKLFSLGFNFKRSMNKSLFIGNSLEALLCVFVTVKVYLLVKIYFEYILSDPRSYFVWQYVNMI